MKIFTFLCVSFCASGVAFAASSPKSTSQVSESASGKTQLGEKNSGAASTAELKIHAAGRRRFNDMIHRRSKALRDISNTPGISASDQQAARERVRAKFIEEEISLELQLRAELRALDAGKREGSR